MHDVLWGYVIKYDMISRLVKHNKILNQFCKLHFCKTLLFRVYYVALLAQSANCFKEEWRFELASNQINIIQLELVTLLTFWYIGQKALLTESPW